MLPGCLYMKPLPQFLIVLTELYETRFEYHVIGGNFNGILLNTTH
jgi:hypothetical protein